MATESLPHGAADRRAAGPIGWMRPTCSNVVRHRPDAAGRGRPGDGRAAPVRWAVLNASWTAVNREQCPAGGACWAFIAEPHPPVLFGLYPDEQHWRLFAGGIVLIVGCVR